MGFVLLSEKHFIVKCFLFYICFRIKNVIWYSKQDICNEYLINILCRMIRYLQKNIVKIVVQNWIKALSLLSFVSILPWKLAKNSLNSNFAFD